MGGGGGGCAAPSWVTGWLAVADPLVTTSVVVRGEVASFLATLYVTGTEPGPVPLPLPVTVAQPPPPETVHC